MLSLLRLEQQHKRFLKLYSKFAYFSFFLTHLECSYPIPDQTGQSLYPFSDQKSATTLPFGAGHMAYIKGVQPQPPPPTPPFPKKKQQQQPGTINPGECI